MGKVVGDLGGTMTVLSSHIGDRLDRSSRSGVAARGFGRL